MTKSKIQNPKIYKKINNVFIKVILFIFYFFIIGLGALIYRLFVPKIKEKNSYWQDSSSDNFDLDYFKSAY